MSATPVTFDSLSIYRTARSLGSMKAIYAAAEAGRGSALYVLAGMDADSKGIAAGFGIIACVRAALADAPYATVQVDPVCVADIR